MRAPVMVVVVAILELKRRKRTGLSERMSR